MSHQVNTELLELASHHIDYWAGEGVGALIEADIERNDLEALSQHVAESAREMFRLEYNPEQESPDVY